MTTPVPPAYEPRMVGSRRNPPILSARLSNSLLDPPGAIAQQCANAAHLLEDLVSCDQIDFGTREGGQAHESIAFLFIQRCLLSQHQHLPFPMLKRMARFLQSDHAKALLTHCFHQAVRSGLRS